MTNPQTPRRLRRLVYASVYSEPNSDLSETLRVILAKSIQNNRLVDVTGKLIVGEGKFLQLLEGPATAVGEVYERIARDARHASLRILSDAPAERRLYRDWNMAHHWIGSGDRAILRDLGLDDFAPEHLDARQALEVFAGVATQA